MFNSLRAFPEWHNMDNAIESSFIASGKKHNYFGLAHGKVFTEFARKQPDQQIQDPVFRADEKVRKVEQFSKDASDVIPKMRTELTKLRPLNEDIKSKRKNYQAIRDRANKTTKAEEKANAKLEQLRATKPGTPEMQKAQDEHDMCLKQKQIDVSKADEREALLAKEEKEYKKQLFLTVLDSLEMYSKAKVNACREMIKISNEIESIGKEIRNYDDSRIEMLQTQLQELKNEPVE
ncbi:hypothetical protein GPJ56_007671 [Histomonas meleagridis]|uniref:uncharacterized protein n=1 Tax=Histomonas meleagridis TaxID=135588 RepID=UPI0035597C67|nr:hypothetical protein GPJ56_007671 [Histomonas meleagridis]KAH0802053.1 hypothetical protein GO595_005134 [Histomonas meleagridis]